MAWRRGAWRDGILGGVLIFVLPVLIVLVAAAFWWGYLGTDDMLEMDPVRLDGPPVGTAPAAD
jgi:hypothetical protein